MPESKTNGETGWDWFDLSPPFKAAAAGLPVDHPEKETARAFARCFRGRDGKMALGHLRSLTLDRALGPGAGDGLLRHLEGQRQLVAYITHLIDRGR